MSGPKTKNGQDAAARYSLSSFIRVISEKFTASAIFGMERMPVSIRTGVRTFDIWQRLFLTCAIPAAAVSGAVAATYSLGSCIKYTPTLFFCAVVLSSWSGGVGAGIFSILLSVLALDYYFIPPIYALGLSLEKAPDLILFVTAGLLVNWMNRDGHHAKNSIRQERDERNLLSSEKNGERGRAVELLQVDSSADSADKKKDHAAADLRNIEELSRVLTKVEADEDLRRELCTQERDPGHTQIAAPNGSGKRLRTRLIRRSARDSIFSKHGDYWTIVYEGQTTCLKATRGLECLACLLANPGREFHVTELISFGPSPAGLAEHRVPEDGQRLSTVHFQDTGPMLDAQAKAEYKVRLAELRAELVDAERLNDPGRVEKIQIESDAIAKQLAVAVGHGGKKRKVTLQAERARTAVTKRIRNTIERIAKATPSLGGHLAVSIKTGYLCSYNPDPGYSVTWKLES